MWTTPPRGRIFKRYVVELEKKLCRNVCLFCFIVVFSFSQLLSNKINFCSLCLRIKSASGRAKWTTRRKHTFTDNHIDFYHKRFGRFFSLARLLNNVLENVKGMLTGFWLAFLCIKRRGQKGILVKDVSKVPHLGSERVSSRWEHEALWVTTGSHSKESAIRVDSKNWANGHDIQTAILI